MRVDLHLVQRHLQFIPELGGIHVFVFQSRLAGLFRLSFVLSIANHISFEMKLVPQPFGRCHYLILVLWCQKASALRRQT